MVRSIIIAALVTGGAFAMSTFFVGYPRGGQHYIAQQTQKRKSLRLGSGYYGPGMRTSGSRGLRGGK